MAALSDYLESGLLNHVFRGSTFAKPTDIAIALTSGAPLDSQTGENLLEIPSGINGSGTGYSIAPGGAAACASFDMIPAAPALAIAAAVKNFLLSKEVPFLISAFF